MKKLTLLFLLLVGCEMSVNSQSLVFMRDGAVVENNATIVVTEIDEELEIMNAHLKVKNVSDQAIEATLTVSVLGIPQGGIIGYCGWGFDSCRPITPGIPLSSTTTLNGGQEIDPDIEALNLSIKNIRINVEYKLTYGENEQNVYVLFTSYNTGITTPKQNVIVNLFQNQDVVSMKYYFENIANRHLNVYNVTGKKTATVRLFDNAGTVQLPNTPKGIYIYAITENEKTVKSGKYIVK
ncbi:MAG: T9SS type A sorting domain-containing protein [Bacteroidales bacterium]|jgi:hypothetical protein|nr:T9SS type A sorting domain-containing protein [Bacteroidales bacterium]